MESFFQSLQSMLPDDFSFLRYLQIGLVVIVGFLLLGLLVRLLFGKKSVINQSICAAIGIVFIYTLTVVIHALGLDLKLLVKPLPFVTLAGDYLHIFHFGAAGYVAVCGELLNMVILGLLVNLINNLLPKGKKFFPWLLLRILSVLLGMLLHVLVSNLLTAFLPEGLLTWAPVILLGLLVLMLLLGALKVLVGAALAAVNPLIGFLYTFFFATLVGKQLTKAVLTTLLLSGLILSLNAMGCTAIFIGASALLAYVPMLILLLALWFVIGRLL